MSETFASILGTTVDNIKPPALIPTGQWLVRGRSASTREITYENKKTGETETAKIFNFGMEPLEAGAGVNQDQVTTGDYEGRQLYHTIFVPLKKNGEPQKGRYMGLVEFLATFGLSEVSELDEFEGKVAAVTINTGTRKNRKSGADELTNVGEDWKPATEFQTA